MEISIQETYRKKTDAKKGLLTNYLNFSFKFKRIKCVKSCLIQEKKGVYLCAAIPRA